MKVSKTDSTDQLHTAALLGVLWSRCGLLSTLIGSAAGIANGIIPGVCVD